jgi:hypothetical protein
VILSLGDKLGLDPSLAVSVVEFIHKQLADRTPENDSKLLQGKVEPILPAGARLVGIVNDKKNADASLDIIAVVTDGAGSIADDGSIIVTFVVVPKYTSFPNPTN